MNTEEKTILMSLAQDVGYIRGVIEPLSKADIPARLSRLETTQKQHEEDIDEIRTKGARRIAVAIAAVAAAGAFASFIVAVISFTISGG